MILNKLREGNRPSRVSGPRSDSGPHSFQGWAVPCSSLHRILSKGRGDPVLHWTEINLKTVLNAQWSPAGRKRTWKDKSKLPSLWGLSNPLQSPKTAQEQSSVPEIPGKMSKTFQLGNKQKGKDREEPNCASPVTSRNTQQVAGPCQPTVALRETANSQKMGNAEEEIPTFQTQQAELRSRSDTPILCFRFTALAIRSMTKIFSFIPSWPFKQLHQKIR